MKRSLLVPLVLPLLMAGPAFAEVPASDDAVMFWRPFQIQSPATATAPVPTNDVWAYFIKQWWFTENTGLYAFYATLSTVTLRLQHKIPLGGGVQNDGTVVGPFAVLTGQAGYRAAVLGASPANMAGGFREGPEVAASLLFPFTKELSANVHGSYAATFPYVDTAKAASLVFYGANLNYKVDAKNTVSAGVLANLLAPFDGTAWTFHNIGPTVTVSHKF